MGGPGGLPPGPGRSKFLKNIDRNQANFELSGPITGGTFKAYFKIMGVREACPRDV